ncbi:MAG: hypothetical protein FJZ95_02750 [Chloroflexi bacterium]|nr:hypothetical protein [Chloroflexota bacterium]
MAGVLPNSEEINATYSLGFDIDDNAATGVSHAGLPGVDRIVYIHATGRIDLGTFGVSGEVYHTIAGTTLPLPQPPEAFSVNEIADFESESEPRATDFFFAIPKALLDLTAVEIPVVTTAGENGLVHDTAEFEFDLERWLKDATFITFGTGVPNPGDYYPIQISGLMPNDRFDLYLDDVLMFSDTLDGSGGFSGGFVFPPSFSNYEPHFLTAQDSTGEFAYGMTCPKAPPTGGGIVEPLVIGPQSVRTPWPIIAGGAMAIVLAISTGGWYLRKRWLRA